MRAASDRAHITYGFEMRIWHQSFTDFSNFPLYRQTIQKHADEVLGGAADTVVHGLRPGTYPQGVAPMEANRNAYVKSLGAQQVCEAAQMAQSSGFDVMALGCIFDPGLKEARSLVTIPIVSLAETTMMVASSLGRRVAYVALNTFQKAEIEDRAHEYGFSHRLAGVVPMEPEVNLFALEDEAENARICAGFLRACDSAIALGADVIVPGDGVLNEFVYSRGLLDHRGAKILDGLGTLFLQAEMFAKLHSRLALSTNATGRASASPHYRVQIPAFVHS